MFDATLCRRIRKGDNAVLFQCDALHFQKGLHFAVCDSEVEPGIPIGDFSLNYGIFGEKRTLAQPFLRSIVWNLGVQIDEQGSLSGTLLFHCDQIVSGLSVRIGAMCQIDLVAGDKQFPAAPGVLDVDTFCLPVQIDHCNKTVRTF